jgi:hypothetical protein
MLRHVVEMTETQPGTMLIGMKTSSVDTRTLTSDRRLGKRNARSTVFDDRIADSRSSRSLWPLPPYASLSSGGCQREPMLSRSEVLELIAEILTGRMARRKQWNRPASVRGHGNGSITHGSSRRPAAVADPVDPGDGKGRCNAKSRGIGPVQRVAGFVPSDHLAAVPAPERCGAYRLVAWQAQEAAHEAIAAIKRDLGKGAAVELGELEFNARLGMVRTRKVKAG